MRWVCDVWQYSMAEALRSLEFVRWQRELVAGILGADSSAFHFSSHCNNFLETVGRCAGSPDGVGPLAVNVRGHHRVRLIQSSVAFRKIYMRAARRRSGAERAALCDER